MSIIPGTYRARAVSGDEVQFGKSTKGTEQVGVLFELLDEDDLSIGERITWIGYFSDKSWDRTIESLKFCGWDPDTGIGQIGDIATNVVELVIEESEWEGKIQLRVQWVNKPGAGGKIKFKEKLETGELNSLMSRIRARSSIGAPSAAPAAAPKPRGARGGRGAAPPPVATSAGASDDDIPF